MPPRARFGLKELAKRAAVVGAAGFVPLVLLVGFVYAVDALLLVFAGVLFAIFLSSLSDLFKKFARLDDNWSLVAAVLFVVLLAAATVWLLVPSIAEQTTQLQTTLPESVQNLKEYLQRYDWGHWILNAVPEPTEMVPRRQELFGRVTGVVSGELEAVGAVVVVFFTGLYLAAQPGLYTRGVVKLVALSQRDRVAEVLDRVGGVLKWWLIGQLAAMLFVGVLTYVGLLLIGIDMALALAVLAALLTFIPNFGPLIALIPALLIGLLDGPMTAVWILALYQGIQIVESYLVTPLLQQRMVSLPPALTLIAQLLMAIFVGGVGLALATPTIVVLMVLVRSFYIRDMLGDHSDGDEQDA